MILTLLATLSFSFTETAALALALAETAAALALSAAFTLTLAASLSYKSILICQKWDASNNSKRILHTFPTGALGDS